MAVTPVEKPTRPVNEMLRIFAVQTEEDFVINMITQRIWPYEVYPGYKEVNEERKKNKQWYSTGDAAKSFKVSVENDDPFHMTLVAQTMDYMRYVDIGVGIWGDSGEIKRSRKADHARRYYKWPNTATKQGNMSSGKSHRPFWAMQIRHLLSRMRDYAVDFYGYEGLGKVVNVLDGMEVDIWGGVFNLNSKEI